MNNISALNHTLYKTNCYGKARIVAVCVHSPFELFLENHLIPICKNSFNSTFPRHSFPQHTQAKALTMADSYPPKCNLIAHHF